jgi:hypothetical protein
LLARSLAAARDIAKHEEAICEFRKALVLSPGNSGYWCGLVWQLLAVGNVDGAAREICSRGLRFVEDGHDSVAQHILNWIIGHHQIAVRVSADLVKTCVCSISELGSGLLVTGCLLPHDSRKPRQRSEILRILWAGTQCGIPIDELCRREGIDERTYYRWRRRYLPVEWQNALALA